MATAQLSASSISTRNLPSFEGLRPSAVKFSSVGHLRVGGLNQRSLQGLVVKAATAVAPKYTSVKPLGDRVLVKIKNVEEKTDGGILLPTTAQTKPQGGEVVAIGEGKTLGKTKVDISVKTGTQVMMSRISKPLNDRVLIKVAEAEEKTAGGLLLTEATKDKPSIGTVIAVGPGPLDEEGNPKPLSITPGNTVLYSKYAGNDFKGKDGSEYIALRASDVMAVLS
ncbi:20 kDa chaperonin, chloroplastic [Quillaja saponaria]|uniref:20 kDa chaperonin, chloroplastic n=1 Tax=Quillaja saponaria TaxID=32244 RepID=A0AAD7QCU1_QUISA|nr:20 kDa chaperonin, chloroplastic [Quillaja saponaria]